MTVTTPNRGRWLLERGLRALALTSLVAALVVANRPSAAPSTRSPVRRWSASELSDSTAAALTTVLGRELRTAAGDTIPRIMRVELASVPAPRARAMLGALAGAHVAVQWVDQTQSAGLALSATRAAGPSAAIDVRTAGPARSSYPLVLGDAGGTLDSIPTTRRAAWRLVTVSAPLRLRLGASEARVAVAAPIPAKRVLLIAQPGWEAKFVSAALEEAGWSVDGSLRVSPRASVTLGAPGRLDTARYATVVLLDSIAVDAAAIGRFVRQGGGLVLGGDALRIAALASIRPARATALRGAVAGALLTDAPQRGLEAWELVVMPGATVVRAEASDHAHVEPVLVAQRVGAGRVVATAYRNSWRWRMEGTDDGAADHRAWWGAVLSLAAGMPALSAPSSPDAFPADAAPYADLVARVGRPTPGDLATPTSTVRARSLFDSLMDRLRTAPGLLFTVIGVALVGEWASRRLRGDR